MRCYIVTILWLKVSLLLSAQINNSVNVLILLSLSQSCSLWKCGMFYVFTVCWVAGYKVWKCPDISPNTRLTSEWRNIGRCQDPGTPHRGHVRDPVTLSTSRPGDQENVRPLSIIPIQTPNSDCETQADYIVVGKKYIYFFKKNLNLTKSLQTIKLNFKLEAMIACLIRFHNSNV